MTNLFHAEGTEPQASEVLLGDSPAAHRLRLQIARIAPHFRIALLTGEPGTGKQTVARHLHRLSPAAGSHFSILPVAQFIADAIPHPGGTVFLQGLDGLDHPAQRKLLRNLRAVQGRARIIFVTSADLKGMAATGRLQPELLAAVATLELRIPPLRDRIADLEVISRGMLTRRNPHASLSSETLQHLRGRLWPGNLRELDALCRQLAMLSRAISADDLPLPDPAHSIARTPARLEDVMRRHVLDVLESCSGNKLRAAELLGISRSTLYRMLEAQPA